MVFWFTPVSSDRHTELRAIATAPAATPANTQLTTRWAEITSPSWKPFGKQQPTFQSAGSPARLCDIVGSAGGWASGGSEQQPRAGGPAERSGLNRNTFVPRRR